MLIKDKIKLDNAGLVEHGAATIVAFGDSVTHGVLQIGEVDYDAPYWNVLRKKLHEQGNYIPINVINAGIEGITATKSLARLERDVLSYHPDLVIVCFGLNDINDPLEQYLASLRTILLTCKERCEQVIFLSPNMLNTYVAPETKEDFKAYAAVTAGYQNEGKMDDYILSACDVARDCGVLVCDMYSHWKELARQGVDTTKLLSNSINHPTRQMHEVTAQKLYDLVMA